MARDRATFANQRARLDGHVPGRCGRMSTAFFTSCPPAARGDNCQRTFRRRARSIVGFATWRDACLFEKINHALVIADRERIGRQASPSATIIDSQSVKTTEAGEPR